MIEAWQISALTREAEKVYGRGSFVRYYGAPPHCSVSVVGPDGVRAMAEHVASDWNAVVSKAEKHLLGMPLFGDVRRSDVSMPMVVNSDADVPGVEGSSRELQLQYDRAPIGAIVTVPNSGCFIKTSSTLYSDGGRMERIANAALAPKAPTVASIGAPVPNVYADCGCDDVGEFQAKARRVYGDNVTVCILEETLCCRASVMRGERTVIEWCRPTRKDATDAAIARLGLMPSRDGVNATNRADVLRHKETTDVTTPKPTLKETIATDATDAAWRVAGSQLTKTVRDPLVAMLSRNLAPGDDAVRARIASFLETEFGVGLLAGVLSAGLSAMPAPAGSPAEVLNSRLARELRIKSMATVGDALADVLAGPLREVAATYLRGVPEAVSGLPESTRITDVAFDPSTTAATR